MIKIRPDGFIRTSIVNKHLTWAQIDLNAIRNIFARFCVISLILFTLPSCSGETAEKIYPHYQDALNDGAFSRGWIPDLIPQSSFEIYEKHNIETNEILLWFQYEKDFNQVLVSKCQQLKVAEVNWPRLKARWWPADLTATSQFSTPRFIFYHCRYIGYFAVNPNDKEAYFWRLSQ